MTKKTMSMVVALAVGASLFADPCRCGRPECTCGDDCRCTPETCKCGCAADKDVLAEEKDEFPVSAEFGLAFDSKYLTYGVMDGKDPIMTPSATVTFFDTLYFGVSSIFDVTKGNGKRGGYGNRAFKYTTLDATVGVTHDFDLGETLGALTVDVNYIYEYIRRRYDEDLGKDSMGDTQYLNLELSLGDLWLEPTLAIERDLMADNGTYVNFEIGHTFALIDGEGEDADPVLALRPSVGQGFGNTQRVKGYFGEDHGGFMDTNVKGELTWNICENLALTAYVACYDYLFDRNMRHMARDYNGAWGNGGKYRDSYQFVGGVALTASF